ncbi:hypothetical protein [Dyella agri]|uniref:Lipoprotein n=1 Tax=Dyella agri TaxID=1926869 RepID=A0ABW8KIZ7_9GAMM
MGMRKQAFTVAMGLMICLLIGCGRDVGMAHDSTVTFYPLGLELVCDQSTPSPLRTDYPVRDVENAVGTDCIERNSGADALTISEGNIYRNKAFSEPLYEIHFHIDRKDWKRVDAVMSKAMQTRRSLAFIVNGSIVARAFVTSVPKEGVIEMGGYGSVKEAEVVVSRFEVSRAGERVAKGGAAP